MSSNDSAQALGIYLHLPWCESKCPYCDFNSHALRGALPVDAYVDALLADINEQHAALHGRRVASIFIGGGTPSLFPATAIGRLIDAMAAVFTFERDIEITLEANPGSVELRELHGYRQAGVNRLSIGVQSFSQTALTALGRKHSAVEAQGALGHARAAGFDNVNLDLMFALPEQSLAAACRDVEQAIALAPEHLSLYQLTLEPGTRFYKNPPALPDDDAVAEMQVALLSRLADADYARYEVSAYARPGKACRHNLNYWRFGDYIALGAGAHGKLTDATGQPGRYRRPQHPSRYMAARPALAAALEALRPADVVFEFFLNALRLTDGHHLAALPALDPTAQRQLERAMAEAEAKALLIRDADGSFRASPLGFRFLNDLQALFLP